MQYKWFIDLGSHSAKLYHLESVELVKYCLRSWKWIQHKYDCHTIYTQLKNLLNEFSVNEPILAMGTAALRNNTTLREHAEQACNKLSIPLKVITQQQEAELIRLACQHHGYSNDYTIIDAGGGSIQLIQPDQETLFYSYGLNYLTQQFNLSDKPENRNIKPCIDWLTSQLPKPIDSFIYTGGEKRYLEHLAVPLTKDKCAKSDFIKLANQLAPKTLEELRSLSPFDPEWMDGAIASNCLIVALLSNSSEDFFMANNLTIVDGLPLIDFANRL
ncbi:hypothetical protein H0A36_18275 [Endozoicomonas sp. SM1973]|uniref:Ppx/GppA phosphatase N-terminal domain-containing protein n=1 Tax=Spartinivicinus marinus TaxID=2994442 RepID=A0A853IJZ3_9GAMM|nr:hypothetical protein [Spartinivicinus marinus]MCX4027274.1 hypothetical protein [Spartinivicinus marinus]NYZ67966.1 hypothetical protein [Spartinivicinus marinus]